MIVDEVFLDYGLDVDAGAGKGHVATAALGRPVERSSTAMNAGENSRSLHAQVDRPSPIHKVGRDDRASFAGNQEVLTFTLSGLSKVAALPQMKVAWVVTSGPQELAATAMGRLEVIADTYLSMNAPVQWAVPALLKQREEIQRQLLERVKANLADLDRQLAGQKACQRLELEGGWYAVLRVPVTRSDEELAIELLRERAVVMHPGHFFDFPSDGYLVLSLITPTEEFAVGIAAILEKLES